jgi:hypothetical protein
MTESIQHSTNIRYDNSICLLINIDKFKNKLTEHSGRQLGGTPTNPDWQEQTGLLLTSLQALFGPHGDGTHGLSVTTGSIGRLSIGIGRQADEASPV